MLHVPALKPDQESFDGSQDALLHPRLQTGSHSLPLSHTAAPGAVADSSGNAADEQPDPAHILDHTLAKDAVTSLHIEDDEQRQKLLAYSHSQICDIIPDYLRFIKAQQDKYAALLKTNRQRHLFAATAQAYFDQAPARARTLRDTRIGQFQRETIERQNSEFRARALRPETIMDDNAQAQYRDMILHNIELLLADAPSEERETALDAASRELYQEIIDARLSLAPASVAPLLASPAVRRVLPRDILAHYRATVENAVLRDTLIKKANAWVAQDIAPGAAKQMAADQYADPETQSTLITLFTTARTNFFRKRYLKTFLDAEAAWNALKSGEYNPAFLPAQVKNGDQDLFECVMFLLAERERRGGLDPLPDYDFALRFFTEFAPEKTAEHLSQPGNVYAFIKKVGGFESPLYTSLLHLLLGRLTRQEQNRFICLTQARDTYVDKHGEDTDREPEKLNQFIDACDTVRRLRLKESNREEMDVVEMRGIIEECLLFF